MSYRLRTSRDDSAVLLIGVDDAQPVTVLEGNHRLTAALLASPEILQLRFRVFCGLSPHMSESCWYQTNFANLWRYGRNRARNLFYDRDADVERAHEAVRFDADIRNLPWRRWLRQSDRRFEMKYGPASKFLSGELHMKAQNQVITKFMMLVMALVFCGVPEVAASAGPLGSPAIRATERHHRRPFEGSAATGAQPESAERAATRARQRDSARAAACDSGSRA